MLEEHVICVNTVRCLCEYQTTVVLTYETDILLLVV